MATSRPESRQTVTELRARGLCGVTETGGLAFQIQRELRSPNRFLGMHWREKYRERKRWQAALTNAVVESLGLPAAQQRLSPASGLPGATGVRTHIRQRVTLERQAPSRRRFVRDDDNLRFAIKPILDALKQLELIFDDRRTWIELVEPTQAVSADGTFWTHLTIEPLGDGR